MVTLFTHSDLVCSARRRQHLPNPNPKFDPKFRDLQNLGAGYKSPSPALRALQYERIVARLARVVIPGIPYHVTHRGNRRQDIRFPPGAVRRRNIRIRSKVKEN
jgi:hypothetical protein